MFILLCERRDAMHAVYIRVRNNGFDVAGRGELWRVVEKLGRF